MDKKNSPLKKFVKSVNHVLTYIIENIYIETFNSLLVISVFSLSLLAPGKIHALYQASYFYKVLWHFIFTWLVLLRAYRFIVNMRRIRSRSRSWTFIKSRKLYRTVLKNIKSAYTDSNGLVYSYQGVNTDNFESLVRLAHDAWDIEDGKLLRSIEERREYFNTLHTINGNAFSMLKKEQEEIGYVSVLPIKSPMHFAGQKCQYLFDDDDVKNEASPLVYLQAVFKKSEHQDTDGGYKILISCLINKIAEHLSDVNKGILYAEQFTDDGEYLLRKMGFQKQSRVSGSDDPKPFWELNMDAKKLPRHFKERKNALRTIKAIRSARERM